MLTLRDVQPVLDLALAPEERRGQERVSATLTALGWTPAPTSSDRVEEERHWRAPEAPGVRSLGASLWTTSSPERGIELGLIIEASTVAAAEMLREQILNHLLTVRRFDSLPSDEVWSNWSDGNVVVGLAVHAGTTAKRRNIPPTVQVGFERAEHDEEVD